MTNDKNILEQSAEHIGDFDAQIEDGKMIITPAEAGIALFGYIKMTEELEAQYQRELELTEAQIEKLREDAANTTDVMERAAAKLLDAGYPDLSAEILEILYPISGVLPDGTEVPFKYGVQE